MIFYFMLNNLRECSFLLIHIHIYIQYKSVLFNPACFRHLHANRVTPIRDEPIQEKSLC